MNNSGNKTGKERQEEFKSAYRKEYTLAVSCIENEIRRKIKNGFFEVSNMVLLQETIDSFQENGWTVCVFENAMKRKLYRIEWFDFELGKKGGFHFIQVDDFGTEEA